MVINQYLIDSFKNLGKSQKEVIKDLGKSQPYVSALMRGKKAVGRDVAQQLNDLYGFDVGAILTSSSQVMTNTYNSNVSAPSPVYKNELEPIEQSKYLDVSLVPIHAQAGFLNGYGDTAYYDGLPTEKWEVDREYKGRYLVFEVKGDSMDDGSYRSILEGDKILCREVNQVHWKSKLHFNKWFFVIVHREDGIIVKEIADHNPDTGDITYHSLNPYYENKTINLKDVIALYNVVDLKRKPKF